MAKKNKYQTKLASLSTETLQQNYPWRYFGAQVKANTTNFCLFAPEATEIILLREGNDWGKKYEPLQKTKSGIWKIKISENLKDTEYKYHIRNDHDYLEKNYEQARIDPFSFQIASHHNDNGGCIYNSVVIDHDEFEWNYQHIAPAKSPMSIYELHLDTFLKDSSYREIAKKLVLHLNYLGFTHVQIMPPFQTPIHESWGYLVGAPYAIYNRHGTVNDFKWLVNHLHQNNIGVIVDLPLGFSIQDWDCGIACLDGTDIFHHAGNKGWNSQWQTRIYNHTSPYVRNYLIGLCAYLHQELGIAGVRIDAVSAQIFKDYDRGENNWERNQRESLPPEDWKLINSLGGDQHFSNRGYWLSEALDMPVLHFFREMHTRLKKQIPDFFTIAEESRRVFPRLATPVEAGGLGFTYAQNMGEMHRVRKYLHKPTEERRIEEIESIMLSPHPENFVNAMNTHDECANGRERLITELKNHVQLISLAAFCWLRPGAPMIFMGDEFCEETYFDVSHYLDWSKTGPGAQLHCQQMTNCLHDLNYLLTHNQALAHQESTSIDRNGSNNEDKWFSFIRWGSEAGWDNNEPKSHQEDIIFIRNENSNFSHKPADIYCPAKGLYQVIFNSIDERYIGQTEFNRHDPYWAVHSQGYFINISLAPYQSLALKLKL